MGPAKDELGFSKVSQVYYIFGRFPDSQFWSSTIYVLYIYIYTSNKQWIYLCTYISNIYIYDDVVSSTVIHWTIPMFNGKKHLRGMLSSRPLRAMVHPRCSTGWDKDWFNPKRYPGNHFHGKSWKIPQLDPLSSMICQYFFISPIDFGDFIAMGSLRPDVGAWAPFGTRARQTAPWPRTPKGRFLSGSPVVGL